MNPYSRLQPFNRESGALNVVIDTPEVKGKKFKPLRRVGPAKAKTLVAASQ
jgi:hypothetical protein